MHLHTDFGCFSAYFWTQMCSDSLTTFFVAYNMRYHCHLTIFCVRDCLPIMARVDNMLKKISIGLIDRHTLFREGMKRIIESHSSLKVVADGRKLSDALKMIKKCQPDIMLLHIQTLEKSHISPIKELLTCSADTKLIILSDYCFKADHVIWALHHGVYGLLLKEMNDEAFFEAIATVHKGKFWLHPHVSHILVKEYHKLRLRYKEKTFCHEHENKIQRPLHLLTSRECDVLEMLAKGCCNREIANRLCITESTVKNHVGNILGKVHVSDRTSAVILAIKNGWVEADSPQYDS